LGKQWGIHSNPPPLPFYFLGLPTRESITSVFSILYLRSLGPPLRLLRVDLQGSPSLFTHTELNSEGGLNPFVGEYLRISSPLYAPVDDTGLKAGSDNSSFSLIRMCKHLYIMLWIKQTNSIVGRMSFFVACCCDKITTQINSLGINTSANSREGFLWRTLMESILQIRMEILVKCPNITFILTSFDFCRTM
jgi:hypothetical protein